MDVPGFIARRRCKIGSATDIGNVDRRLPARDTDAIGVHPIIGPKHTRDFFDYAVRDYEWRFQKAGQRLQSLGDIDGVTDHGELVMETAFKYAAENRTVVQADTRIQTGAALLDFLTAPFFERLGQSQRAGQCPPRVVRLWLRLPKHSHHPIADELVHSPAIGEHSAA